MHELLYPHLLNREAGLPSATPNPSFCLVSKPSRRWVLSFLRLGFGSRAPASAHEPCDNSSGWVLATHRPAETQRTRTHPVAAAGFQRRQNYSGGGGSVSREAASFENEMQAESYPHLDFGFIRRHMPIRDIHEVRTDRGP